MSAERCRTFLAYPQHARTNVHCMFFYLFKTQGNTFGTFGTFGTRRPVMDCRDSARQ